jgi:hypothetical protein
MIDETLVTPYRPRRARLEAQLIFLVRAVVG